LYSKKRLFLLIYESIQCRIMLIRNIIIFEILEEKLRRRKLTELLSVLPKYTR